MQPIIELKGLTKRFGSGETEVAALNGIDISIRPGEIFGVIGLSGAGKSTLLKLLSRVTAPTEGEIDINGRIASMLEVGTGFNGEMTGRENIYMNGAILGMTKAEIDRKFDEIVEFNPYREWWFDEIKSRKTCDELWNFFKSFYMDLIGKVIVDVDRDYLYTKQSNTGINIFDYVKE